MSLNRTFPTANDNQDRYPPAHGGWPHANLPPSPAEALVPERPPEPPEREPPEENDHPFLRMLGGLFTFFFILACLAIGIFYFMKVQLDQPGPLTTSTVVVVPKGEGITAMAERLERDGVISDRRIFMTSILYFMHLKGYGSLKAGEYELSKQASLREVLDTLVKGKSIEHKITFPEGLTSQQIVARLLAHPELTGEITEIPPEGSLLPDTYRFGSDDSRANIIERMQHAQKKFLAKMWEERQPDIMVNTPEEALVLASIVEKETGKADERPHVASVFHNRLKKKMRLQSDPTIIYGIFGGSGMRDHPITRDEIDRHTPYNTYKIDGLPPTPIANPGRAAIEAVLKPAKSEYLYFCADGTGGHAFASTLAEHNKNVAQWRVVEREIRARQAEAAAAAAAAAEAAKTAADGDDPEATTTAAAIADPAAPQEATPAETPEAQPAAPAAKGPPVPLPRRKPQP